MSHTKPSRFIFEEHLMPCQHEAAEIETEIADGVCPICQSARVERMRVALEVAAACFDALDPRQPSGLSDAETANLFNATREAVRLALT